MVLKWGSIHRAVRGSEIRALHGGSIHRAVHGSEIRAFLGFILGRAHLCLYVFSCPGTTGENGMNSSVSSRSLQPLIRGRYDGLCQGLNMYTSQTLLSKGFVFSRKIRFFCVCYFGLNECQTFRIQILRNISQGQDIL